MIPISAILLAILPVTDWKAAAMAHKNGKSVLMMVEGLKATNRNSVEIFLVDGKKETSLADITFYLNHNGSNHVFGLADLFEDGYVPSPLAKVRVKATPLDGGKPGTASYGRVRVIIK